MADVIFGDPGDSVLLGGFTLERAARTYVPFTQLTITADGAGDREASLAFAQRAWDDREPPFILLARHFRGFQQLRRDPQFAAIVAQLDADASRRNP